jgi:predicted nucleic-acid-binding protein
VKALDTNVLLRFIVADNPGQAARARRLLETAEREGMRYFVSQSALLEWLWALGAVYEYGRNDILKALESLIFLPVLECEARDRALKLIRLASESPVGLADLWIALGGREHGCDTTLTFDKKAARSDLFELL